MLANLRGLKSLFLFETQVSDINPLTELTGLRRLDFSFTRVNDIEPLARLRGLRSLQMRGTIVKNLTALKELKSLRSLSLAGTQVSELEVLSGLFRLQDLDISSTQVRDLRQICDLPLKGAGPFEGLRFDDTPAVKLDMHLEMLERLGDHAERTKKTSVYLKTLPPWPEPLPWLMEGAKAIVARPTRVEPTVTRGGGIKASATQIKFLLREPQMTRMTANHVATQIRDALRDVRPVEGNQLPAALQSLLEFADVLKGLGKANIAPKARAREEDLRLRIAQLEAIIERLTKELKDTNAANTKDDGFTKNFPKEMARTTAETLGLMMRVGTITGVVYFLGPTNPAVASLISIWAALAKISK